MAGTLAQNAINAFTKIFQKFKGHKGLDGTGKAAAVDPEGALSV